MKRLLTLLIALSVLVVSPLALAEGGGKSTADKRAKLESRMKQLRARVLRKDVGLDDKKAAEVEKILTRHAPERKKLQKESRTQRQTLRRLVQSDSNDQPAYDKALRALRATQKKLHAQRDKELDELAKVLTPKQQAKLLIGTRKLQAQLRKRVRQFEDRD